MKFLVHSRYDVLSTALNCITINANWFQGRIQQRDVAVTV
jgi:hypothetical protein